MPMCTSPTSTTTCTPTQSFPFTTVAVLQTVCFQVLHPVLSKGNDDFTFRINWLFVIAGYVLFCVREELISEIKCRYKVLFENFNKIRLFSFLNNRDTFEGTVYCNISWIYAYLQRTRLQQQLTQRRWKPSTFWIVSSAGIFFENQKVKSV